MTEETNIYNAAIPLGLAMAFLFLIFVVFPKIRKKKKGEQNEIQ